MEAEVGLLSISARLSGADRGVEPQLPREGVQVGICSVPQRRDPVKDRHWGRGHDDGRCGCLPPRTLEYDQRIQGEEHLITNPFPPQVTSRPRGSSRICDHHPIVVTRRGPSKLAQPASKLITGEAVGTSQHHENHRRVRAESLDQVSPNMRIQPRWDRIEGVSSSIALAVGRLTSRQCPESRQNQRQKRNAAPVQRPIPFTPVSGPASNSST